MKVKKFLLLCMCLLTGFSTVKALNYQYVGKNNTKITNVAGIGTTGFYLLEGNLGVKDAAAGTAGGYYSGITAKGSAASEDCVCRLINATDSTFYVYFPSTESYWKIPTKWDSGALTGDKKEAATVKIKASSNIAGTFDITYSDTNNKVFYFQDWGSSGLGVYPPSENNGAIDVDGESEWTIYRADVKQEADFPLLVTKADGIPSTPSATAKTFHSRTFYSSEPISSVRFTVMHTAPGDSYNAYDHIGYVFFALSEMGMYDADGKKIELTADNFSSNATEESEGAIANLCDGDLTNYFHSCWDTHTGIIGGEHYLEVSLPEPVYGFSFEMTARNNYKNFPCEIGITKGGVAYDIYAESGFTANEEVELGSLKAGKLYIMKSAVNDAQSEYPAYAVNKRARITPNTDCIFSLVDAGNSSYYIKYYLRGEYVSTPAGAGNIGLTTDMTKAGAFTFNADGTISGNGYNLYLQNEALAVKADTAVAWKIYSASIDRTQVFSQLKSAIDAVQLLLDTYGDSFASNDDGEKSAVVAELENANALYGTPAAESAEILVEIDALNAKAARYRALEILSLCDSIDEILMTEHFENVAGAYPVGQSTTLNNSSSDSRGFFDAGTYTTIAQVESYIAGVKSVIATFWSSLISETVLPVKFNTDNGLPGTASNGRYTWTSPLLFFGEPISKLRMTVNNTNTGDNGAGYYCFGLGEFYVLDANGDSLALTAGDFRTNAQEPSEGPIENICDKDPATYFHSRWSEGGANTGEHYIEVTLPEPMYALSFGYITRNERVSPTEMTITDGSNIIKSDSIGFKLGDQIASAADLNTNDYYVLYGNLNRLSQTPTDGSGYYNGITLTGYEANRNNLFRLEESENGSYHLHFLLSDKYIATPTGWDMAATTYKAQEAGNFLITESPNLEQAFYIYQDGSFSSDYPNCHYMLQDWGSDNMGVFPVSSLDSTDMDGESDWYIYKATFTANPDSVEMVGVINHAIAVSPSEGNNPGCFGDLTDYKSAFGHAVELRYQGTSSSDYVAATAALRNALNNLNSYIEPQIGKTYIFVSAYGEYLKQQGTEKAMYAADAATMGWGNIFDASMDSAQYYWTLEESQENAGYVAIKNLFTGTYIGFSSTNSATISMSETATDYSIELLGKAQFALKSMSSIEAGCDKSYACLHTGEHGNGAGEGGSIVNWNAFIDGATAWYLREVEPTLVDLTTVEAAKVATTTYYTLNGQMVAAPSKGLYIIKKVYSDGTTHVQKILIK